MNNNRGLHLKPIVTEGDKKHYVLGGFTKVKGEVINPSGDWTNYLPVGEGQRIDQRDTYACADFGTLNALETLLNFKYGITTNYSDRALAIDADTKVGYGTDPHDVAETIRKKGVVKEETLPTNEAKTVEEFYTPKPLTQKIRKEADEWTWNWAFGHEWLFILDNQKEKIAKLKEALTRGTVCVSVYAWIYDYGNKWYYKPEGVEDNHWVQLVKFEGECPIIFDSNEGYTKKLAPDFDFSVAKVYYLNKLDGQKKKSILSQILEIIKKILQIDTQIITKEKVEEVKTLDEILIPMPESKLFTIAKETLGKDASPRDLVSDGVGCAESVSTLIKKIVPTFPILTGTWSIYDALKGSKYFTPVLEATLTAGDIILCATGMGNGTVKNGHVGIVGDDLKIMSNNSKTGIWEYNFTLQSWKDYFVKKGGYKLYCYRLKVV